MDLSAIIMVVTLTALFLGFIIWMALHSRKNEQEKLGGGKSQMDFPETRKQNEQVLGK